VFTGLTRHGRVLAVIDQPASIGALTNTTKKSIDRLRH
jgi:hypothetical protein